MTEFPKSGGTWFCQMLSEIIGLPFPRNENLKFSPSILHGHYISNNNSSCPIHILRDGRDVMISAYYYFLLNQDTPNWVRQKWRARMPQKRFENIKENLPDFLYVFFKHYRVGFNNVRWDQFVKKYLLNDAVLTVKYEDLSKDPETSILKSLNWLKISVEVSRIRNSIDKYKFTNQIEKVSGQMNTNTFLRKGIVGDWKNHFTTRSAEIFNLHAGDALIIAGYEKNSEWF